MIGVSGSYSLHWSQWGHTLTDFQRPLANMRLPWRALRSFGVYKPSNRDWGWDYVTVSSCRIANEDVGFTIDDLEDFTDKGGFWWLPRQLQGNLSNAPETGFAWVYFLQETAARCEEASARTYCAALATYALIFIVAAFATRRGRTGFFLNIGIGSVRLVALHAVLLLFAWQAGRRVVNCHWSRNIRSQRSFSLSKAVTLAPELPATLPTEHDVLIFESMQSEYFGSYTSVLEVVHPGNKAWHGLVLKFATGYDNTSPELQAQIRLSVRRIARHEHRRILLKNNNANWAEVSSELADNFCHESLRRRANQFVNSAMDSLGFLYSETKFGYWRDTSLYRRFASKLVASLREKVLDVRHHNTKRFLGGIPNATIIFAAATQSLPVVLHESKVSPKPRRRSGIPIEGLPQEPYPGAWMQETDWVEATFDGRITGKILVKYLILELLPLNLTLAFLRSKNGTEDPFRLQVRMQ